MNYNDILYSFCCRNDTDQVKTIFKRFNKNTDELDALYSHGWLFNIAISKNNVEICKMLLDFFENKQFPIKNNEYAEAKEKLKEILENATDSIELSPEMKQVLSPYLNFEDSDSDIADLSDVGVDGLDFEENLPTVGSLLTKEN